MLHMSIQEFESQYLHVPTYSFSEYLFSAGKCMTFYVESTYTTSSMFFCSFSAAAEHQDHGSNQSPNRGYLHYSWTSDGGYIRCVRLASSVWNSGKPIRSMQFSYTYILLLAWYPRSWRSYLLVSHAALRLEVFVSPYLHNFSSSSL